MTLLSRAAENLFWIARYFERAESTARLIDMAFRMSSLPSETPLPMNEWASVLMSAGCAHSFERDLSEADQASVANYLLLDPANPSSVYSCLEHARINARSVRTTLTSDVWEAINDGWFEIRNVTTPQISGGALPVFVDWIKKRGALFRGTARSSLLRNDGYDFLRIGSMIERADNTARLLDVKYHVLLPSVEDVGGAVDYYQWVSVLRASNSLRAYHWAYRKEISPVGIADFLILNLQNPRSLGYSYDKLTDHLNRLAAVYRQSHECHERVVEGMNRLMTNTVETIFSDGLHEFLTSFIQSNSQLSVKIGEAYGFGGPFFSSESADRAEE